MRSSPTRICTAALLAMAVAACSSAPVRVVAEAPQEVAPPPRWQFSTPAEAGTAAQAPKWAVLLPMSGSAATAAAPVRDGLMTAYYNQTGARPELVFYDTAGTAAGAVAAYQRAMTEGAVQLLGPLTRDEVAAVFAAAPAVPMVALNRPDGELPFNTTAFSLAPEDDGSAAAQYMLGRNVRRVLVLSDGDEAAQRSLSSFDAALQLGGGQVVEVIGVAGAVPDVVERLRAAASGAQGVDGVLLAMRGNTAHLVAPQLFAAGLGDKLRVATSQITAGTGKAEEDRTLDGIVFPSEPWLHGSHAGLPSAASLAQTLPTARGPAARLFAFGHDAWLLSHQLQALTSNGSAGVAGATGTLRVATDGHVRRTPAWAVWRAGTIALLPRD